MQAAMGLAGTVVVQVPDPPLMQDRIMVLADARQRAHLCFNPLGGWDNEICPGLEKATLNGQWGDGSKGWPFPIVEVSKGQCYNFQSIAFSPQQSNEFEISIQDHKFVLPGGENATSMKVLANATQGMQATLCADQHPVLDHDYSITYSYTSMQGPQRGTTKSFSAIL